ncbi:hypothetical protein M0813_26112 [Anaeramoeba flamelloides]|uniref:Uncharacterized protein n=1 Tax=Anaeramoeba flamelloides TaxID=1746091 RepID=A0ABQ8XZW8_9EUKA|nr:hypothetical protein M0813_26112 [Anaeramoeba flamelloides]
MNLYYPLIYLLQELGKLSSQKDFEPSFAKIKPIKIIPNSSKILLVNPFVQTTSIQEGENYIQNQNANVKKKLNWDRLVNYQKQIERIFGKGNGEFKTIS